MVGKKSKIKGSPQGLKEGGRTISRNQRRLMQETDASLRPASETIPKIQTIVCTVLIHTWEVETGGSRA